MDGARFFALQEGVDEAELSSYRIDPCRKKLKTLVQLAAMIKQLDLVITVDTMIAHLAGMLGKKVWVLCRHNSDWRWKIDDQYSKWYQNVELFKQSSSEKYQ